MLGRTSDRRAVLGESFAVAFGWGAVALGQAHGLAWLSAVVPQERLIADPALFETGIYLLIFVPMIAVAIAGGLFDRRNALAPGARPLAGLGLGLAIGVAGLSAAVLYAKLAGTLSTGPASSAAAGLLGWGLAVIALQVAAEEIYFRGWLQPALTRRWGWGGGILFAALAFATLHIAGGAHGGLVLTNLFLGGLMFGLFAARGGGLAAAFGAHLAWNVVEQLGYGLDPNPGLGSFGAIVDLNLSGAAIWGGSDQGLNGSIGMTIALLAIVVPLALLSWRRLPARSEPVAAIA